MTDPLGVGSDRQMFIRVDPNGSGTVDGGPDSVPTDAPEFESTLQWNTKDSPSDWLGWITGEGAGPQPNRGIIKFGAEGVCAPSGALRFATPIASRSTLLASRDPLTGGFQSILGVASGDSGETQRVELCRYGFDQVETIATTFTPSAPADPPAQGFTLYVDPITGNLNAMDPLGNVIQIAPAPNARAFPGLIWWLRATEGIDVGQVIEWDDSSGAGDANRNFFTDNPPNGPTLIESDPLLGGRPSVRFGDSGSSTLTQAGLWASAPVDQPYTVMIVGYTVDPSIAHNVYIGSNTRNIWYMCSFFDNNTSAPPPFFGSDSGTGVGVNLQSIEPDVGQPIVCIQEVNDPTSTVRINDQTAHYQQLGGVPFNTGLGVLDQLRLGGAFGTGAAGEVVIAEVVIFDRLLDPDDLAALNTYAGDRYDVPITGTRGRTITDPRALGTPLLWLRADKGITGGVAQWSDQSGRGDPNRNVVQTDAGKRPLVGPAITMGGKPSVAFSGSILDMVGLWNVGAIPQPYTIFAVVSDPGSGREQFLGQINDNNWYASTLDGFYAISVGGTVQSTTPDSTSPKVLLIEVYDPNSTITVNAVTPEATGNAGAGALPRLELGGVLGGPTLTGMISEIGLFNRILEDEEKVKLVGSLGAFWSIPVTTT